MATMSDEEFGEFARLAWPRLYRTAYLMLGEHQLAEDLVQTTLARTYASRRSMRDPSSAGAYARTTLANTAATWFRRHGWRNERPTEHLPLGATREADASDRPAVMAALRHLPPRQRAVVVLRYYDDLSVRAVAEALGISEGTVKSQTAHALLRLRDLLGEDVAPLISGATRD